MPDTNVSPADAGNSSNSSTPAADAALVNAASPGGDVANAPTSGGAPMQGAEGNTAEAPPASETVLGKDGEPVPYGNEAQRMVANAIADTFREGNEVTDLNAKINEIAKDRQVQSTPGPTPVEFPPTEQPSASGEPQAPEANKLNVKPEIKAKGTVTPPPATPK